MNEETQILPMRLLEGSQKKPKTEAAIKDKKRMLHPILDSNYLDNHPLIA